MYRETNMNFCGYHKLLFIVVSYIGLVFANPIVKTPLGVVEGTYKISSCSETYSSFEGIPYAKPPVGKLRFEKPEDIEPWPGVWKANRPSPSCTQIGFVSGSRNLTLQGKEDCLYLNVHVPVKKPSSKYKFPVIFVIYGGAFMIGTPNSGPQYLICRNVVVVTISYRIGVMGFLSTGDENLPGNMGMKDQVKALEWVRDNIKYFGGDPNSITLNGFSAGGSSSHLHFFSPLSKDLFHKAISHSGSALVPWTIQEAPLLKARKLADSVGCNFESTKKLVKCLKSREANQLVSNVELLYGPLRLPFSPLAPVVEKKSKHAFLTEHPLIMMQKGKIKDAPIIFQSTQDEGTLPGTTLYFAMEQFKREFNQILPNALDYNYTIPNYLKDEISQKIMEFYLGDEEITEENFIRVINFCGDRLFTYPIEKAARIQARVNKSPVYYSLFSYLGNYTLNSAVFGVDLDFGNAGHADDVLYVYANPNAVLRGADALVKDIQIELMTNFAKFGNPGNPSWKPVTTLSKINYLSIEGPRRILPKKIKELTPTRFWDSIAKYENKFDVSD